MKLTSKSNIGLVLRNAGKIDPSRIQDYISVGGYSAIAKCLATMTPQGVIYEVTTSGLTRTRRRRFPNWAKMDSCIKGA